MTWVQLAVASGVVALGAMIQGSIGFGVNVVAGPVLVLIDPELVPGPALVIAFLLTVLVWVRERGATDLGGFTWVFVGRVPGTVVGALTVAALPARGTAISLSAIVLIAVALSVAGWRVRRTRTALVGAGGVSGFFGTVSSVGGPPIALLYQDEAGRDVRGTLSSIFAVGALFSIVMLVAVGRFDFGELRTSLLLLPAVVAGFVVSRWTARLLDRGFVRPAILALCASSAVAALVRYAI
ncbi:MAG TPA: sulfite exporter TauE/SafE family protein [Actinomycetota bacterium]|nr:sulfite exporter TauE/SafE family protein [Actinomycetota bacterium]